MYELCNTMLIYINVLDQMIHDMPLLYSLNIFKTQSRTIQSKRKTITLLFLN